MLQDLLKGEGMLEIYPNVISVRNTITQDVAQIYVATARRLVTTPGIAGIQTWVEIRNHQ